MLFESKTYLLLIASTGFIRAALRAGAIPEIRPMATLKPKPVAMFWGVITISKTEAGMKVKSETNNKPAIPPIKLKKTASDRN